MFRNVQVSLWILFAVAFLQPGAMAGGGAEDFSWPRPVIITDDPEERTVIAEEGHVLVEWEIAEIPPEEWAFELEESRDPDFEVSRTRYTGRERAVFVSGLLPENSYFRVRLTTPEAVGPWSEPLEVRVEYPSRAWVGGLLGLGAVVFAFTIIAIVTGHFRSRREMDQIVE